MRCRPILPVLAAALLCPLPVLAQDAAPPEEPAQPAEPEAEPEPSVSSCPLDAPPLGPGAAAQPAAGAGEPA